MARRTPHAPPSVGRVVLASGEEVIAERVDDDGVRIVVTSAGRKLAIAPDATVTVLVGQPVAPEPEDADGSR